MLAMVCVMHYQSIYKEVEDLCKRRSECFTGCIQNNFPKLECEALPDISLTYNNAFYDSLYFYPMREDSEIYARCAQYISEVSHSFLRAVWIVTDTAAFTNRSGKTTAGAHVLLAMQFAS